LIGQVQIIHNVLGHAGYEIYPRWLMNTPFKFILNTPTNHVMHHEKMRGNYGIYFNIWDRLMRTNHDDYEHRFRQVTYPAKSAPLIAELK
jgi:sterol desaturase/sphingolipid hydroxylase (fatty acid hydroxylase superfamily)